ncbi:hypothetical protein TL16_g11710 [Triparma laevis f. inornata]|uniref:Uncharacterized protein n=2 Tax=Triparma laevis TaxID=1534972 RepID=A0A9W7FTI8_9STRA|nr:hypothetical protein TL16_g11710 [Triparma laevis f. inornata]GMI17983.1 hypothetical protein TrLO_g9044 [Triparma laevis f. longispina]
MDETVATKLEASDDACYDRMHALANILELHSEPTQRKEVEGDEVIYKIQISARVSQYFALDAFPHDKHFLCIHLTSNISTKILQLGPDLSCVRFGLLNE